MTAHVPWRTFPHAWNRQIIYRFPNGYGASIIAEVDWTTNTPENGFPFDVRDDVVEVGVIAAANGWHLAEDQCGELEIYREVPVAQVDAILDEIEARPAAIAVITPAEPADGPSA